MEMTIRDLTESAAARELDAAELAGALSALLDESVAVPERAAFLKAIAGRGATAAELAGFARELLDRSVGLSGLPDGTIDVCGTGGDRAGFFNISTAAMFVAAGAGALVAKHGNRGITSRSGAADVLEALGVRIDLPPERAAVCLREAGCCFFFAPAFHPALKAVAPVRKYLAEQGSPSIFNMLGPLLNPARPAFQLAGLFDAGAIELYADAMAALGRTRAWAVNGTGPAGLRLDEISTLGPTLVAESGYARPAVRLDFDAADLGFARPDPAGLAGGSAAENAGILEGILTAADKGPRREIVVINAAAALRVCGIAEGWPDAIGRARESIDSGAAGCALARLREASAG